MNKAIKNILHPVTVLYLKKKFFLTFVKKRNLTRFCFLSVKVVFICQREGF